MTATSASLLARLRDPDGDAWSRLVDLYTPLIRSWLIRAGVRPAEADDLVQEVLTVVVRRFPEFRHNERTGAFRAWLRAIAVNCARDFWKASRLRPAAAGGTDFGGYLAQLEDETHPLAAAWDREHDVYVTRRLLDLLRPEFEPKTWAMFRRFVLEEVPAAQVAAELGTTPNAVFIAKSRVLARLRQEAAGLID
ncbi:MAG TPA: sigma-70 family RNA polymerase sigma factor [Gemmataceae bacterium]|nr:sigma-70 family RNA polymerase sigma factor [Gemmataceae bacterium]